MDNAELSRFSLTVDVLVAAPERHRQILDPLLEAAEGRIEGVEVKEAIRAIVGAFSTRDDWETLDGGAQMEALTAMAKMLRESKRDADRLAGGILAWALGNRRQGTRRRRERVARVG